MMTTSENIINKSFLSIKINNQNILIASFLQQIKIKYTKNKSEYDLVK